jgi:hypothetical protein
MIQIYTTLQHKVLHMFRSIEIVLKEKLLCGLGPSFLNRPELFRMCAKEYKVSAAVRFIECAFLDGYYFPRDEC